MMEDLIKYYHRGHLLHEQSEHRTRHADDSIRDVPRSEQ
jgi:hypothetical protein